MQDKVVAITGGACGIGLALAKLLAQQGAIVAIADISRDSLDKAHKAVQDVSTKGPDGVFSQVCDVRKLEAIRSWLRATVDKFGRLDAAANIAGVFSSSSLESQEEDDWNRVIDINMKGVMFCMKAEFEVMTNGGSIVNAASIAGLRGMQGSLAYCASKHGVIGLIRVAAREGAAKQIRVNAIAPGYVDTPMLAQATAGRSSEQRSPNAIDMMPIPRKADPTEVAKVVVFLLGDDSSFVTGAIYNVDGGWHV